ncbi:MAG: response regulator transcription factor [Saprospiraceae bacterium]|nr:response regulator transcription factor [Saprospiraceae bacterium]
MALKAVIADHQSMFTEGLQAIINNMKMPPINIVGIAHQTEDLQKFISFQFDILIIDIGIFDSKEMVTIQELKKTNPKVKIVALTQYSESSIVREAFLKGVDGYILKSSQIIELFECIEDVFQNKTYIGDGVRISPEKKSVKKNADPLSTFKIYEDRFLLKQKLSRRESEVLKHIVMDKSTKEIAEELFISNQTVSAHRKSIMRKLGANTTANLIKFALENQLV